MKTAEQYRTMAYESETNQQWIAKLEREIALASSKGLLFYQRLKWGCVWVRNPLNIEYLEKKGFDVNIYKPKEGEEWVIIKWEK